MSATERSQRSTISRPRPRWEPWKDPGQWFVRLLGNPPQNAGGEARGWLMDVAVALVCCRLPAEDTVAMTLWLNEGLVNPVPPGQLAEVLCGYLDPGARLEERSWRN